MGAKGLMIGRGAVRNPWVFRQIRAHLRGLPIELPTGREVLGYVRALYEVTRPPGIPERAQVQKMKKYLNFVGAGIEPPTAFLNAMRRAETEADLFRICGEHLDHDRPMPLRALGESGVQDADDCGGGLAEARAGADGL
jgi:tRNA-dihydrouridine synthase